MTNFYVQWSRDGDTWLVKFSTEQSAVNAVENVNGCEDWDGDSPMTGVYLGEW